MNFTTKLGQNMIEFLLKPPQGMMKENEKTQVQL